MVASLTIATITSSDLNRLRSAHNLKDVLLASDGNVDLTSAVAFLIAEGIALGGLAIDVNASYPAALAARDVATLTNLGAIEVVVVRSRTHSREHAAALKALLVPGLVTFENDVAHYVDAVNLPTPPRAVRVGWMDGEGTEAFFDDVRCNVVVTDFAAYLH